MSDTRIIEVETFGEIVEYVIIDHGNNQFTSMPKSVYDEQQKAAELGGTL